MVAAAVALSGCASAGEAIRDAVKEARTPPEGLVGDYGLTLFQRNILPYRYDPGDMPLSTCEGRGVPRGYEMTSGQLKLEADAKYVLDSEVFVVCEASNDTVLVPIEQKMSGRYSWAGGDVRLNPDLEAEIPLDWDADKGTLISELLGAIWQREQTVESQATPTPNI
jgi:hypothetical protein